MADQPRIPSWDQRYDQRDFLFGTEPNDFLRAMTSRLNIGELLCLADGEGRNGVFLASLGHQVTSVDASAVGLAKARQLAERRQVSLSTELADLKEWDLGQGQWDTLVSIFFHMPPDFRRKMHQRMAQALKPGGMLVLEAYTPKQLEFRTGGPPVTEMLMTRTTLEDDFPDLELLHLEELEREVIEGTGHHGMASVVQLLARKP